ncbi:uncharacterized protein LOC119105630 [Pollicipes pollicipes]|uniref:uncharacterized protein LOC119105630 n=1 Tax=Pollicipes pollicipes TaxID=41117 RepID=UPI001885029B|nr:uncharacterized protein LOC119105630 [Pollicipes pollicipes]
MDVRFSYSEALTGEVHFRVVSKENVFSYGDPSEVAESARFPAGYPAHYAAEYVIRRPADDHRSAILLSFTDYLLAPWALLEVTDADGSRVASYTGDVFRPPVTVTNTSALHLHFHANGRPGIGFRAKFDFVPPPLDGAPLLPPRTDCGGVVLSAGGAITMLNMTHAGTVWYDCVWLLRARLPGGHAGRLALRLSVFRGFAPGSRLKIVDGPTTRGATVTLVTSDLSGAEASAEHVVDADGSFYVHLQAGFRPSSQLALIYSSFRLGDCGAHREMACGDGRCIAQFLKCDGFAHCPDKSDEADSCYTYSLSTSLGVQNEDTWTLNPPNFYFPGPSHSMASIESATLSLLAMCLIIVLTMTSAVIFIYSNGRVAERRARNRLLRSISDLMRESSVEVVSAAPDEPPVYEPPPDYEQIVHCFAVHRKPKKKRGKKAAQRPHSRLPNLRLQLSTELNAALFRGPRRQLPRHNTVPSLHHFSGHLEAADPADDLA